MNTLRRGLFSKRSMQEHFDASPENVNIRNVFYQAHFQAVRGFFSFSPMPGNVKQMVHFVEVMAYLDTRAYVRIRSSQRNSCTHYSLIIYSQAVVWRYLVKLQLVTNHKTSNSPNMSCKCVRFNIFYQCFLFCTRNLSRIGSNLVQTKNKLDNTSTNCL